MMRLITWAGVALVALPLTLTGGDDAIVKKELKALEGTWNIWPMTEGGVGQIPKYHGPGIAIFICRADGSATVQLLPEGETKATVALDLTKTPKRMVITQVSGSQKGKKQYAIYKLEGDTLTLFATPPGAAEEDRPADFSDKNAKANLLVYKRVKDDKKP
jgi:uncharacterized protein (TIGR03067 family)